MSIGPDLPALIRAHLRSVWSLELLVLLRRERSAWCSAQQLTDELRASPSIVGPALDLFERAGLVVRDDEGRYRYAPASQRLAAFGDAVDREYRERPVAVINLIAAPDERLPQLVDAFRFR